MQVQFPSKLHWPEVALSLDVKGLLLVSLVFLVLTEHGVLEALTMNFSYYISTFLKTIEHINKTKRTKKKKKKKKKRESLPICLG